MTHANLELAFKLENAPQYATSSNGALQATDCFGVALPLACHELC